MIATRAVRRGVSGLTVFAVLVGLLVAAAAGVYIYGVVGDRMERERLPALIEEYWRPYGSGAEKRHKELGVEIARIRAKNPDLDYMDRERLPALVKEEHHLFNKLLDRSFASPAEEYPKNATEEEWSAISERNHARHKAKSETEDYKRHEELEKEIARIRAKNPDLDPHRR